MTVEEQNELRARHYAEALRYMDNAKEVLQKAGKDGSHYADPKYVKMACGTAYSGVLVALDAWLKLKELPKLSKKQRKSIDYYYERITTIDKKMVAELNVAYNILHLDGYYDGITKIKVIECGFDAAYEIIEKIKPDVPVPVKETAAQGLKRAFNNLTTAFAVTFG